MKIIHELSGKHPQVSVTMRPHRGFCAEPPTWQGARVEVLIVDFDQERLEQGEETIEFEGELVAVRTALQDALAQLDIMERMHKEEVADRVAHALPCKVCGTYVDYRSKIAGHPDGRGKTCLGDGTVLLVEQRIEVYSPDGSSDCLEQGFKDLREGSVFRLVSGLTNSSEMQAPYTALDTPYMYFEEHRAVPSARLVVRVRREP